MLAITHTIISLPFAFYMDNPVLIFLAAFTFHFFADTFLHWNIYPWKYKSFPFAFVSLDVLGGLLATYILTGPANFLSLPVLIAIIGGNMPDILQTCWEILPKHLKNTTLKSLKPLFHWHDHLQLETSHIGHGLISQLLIIAIAMMLILQART